MFKTKVLISSAIVYMVVALSLFFFKNIIYDYFRYGYDYVYLFAFLLFLGSISTILYLYLRGSIFRSNMKEKYSSLEFERETYLNERHVRHLQANVEELQLQIDKFDKSRVTIEPDDKQAIIETLQSEIPEALVEELFRKYSNEIKYTQDTGRIRKTFKGASSRLAGEVRELKRRARANLLIGMVMTFFALGVLLYIVFGAKEELTDMTALLSYFVPRVTTVIFIEVFAFFFLRLYRSNLAETKHYLNELTRIDTIQIALGAAGMMEESNTRSAVIENLSRNACRSPGHEEFRTQIDQVELKGLLDILEKVGKLVAKVAEKK